jgi:hypothetical protein
MQIQVIASLIGRTEVDLFSLVRQQQAIDPNLVITGITFVDLKKSGIPDAIENLTVLDEYTLANSFTLALDGTLALYVFAETDTGNMRVSGDSPWGDSPMSLKVEVTLSMPEGYAAKVVAADAAVEDAPAEPVA